MGVPDVLPQNCRLEVWRVEFSERLSCFISMISNQVSLSLIARAYIYFICMSLVWTPPKQGEKQDFIRSLTFRCFYIYKDCFKKKVTWISRVANDAIFWLSQFWRKSRKNCIAMQSSEILLRFLSGTWPQNNSSFFQACHKSTPSRSGTRATARSTLVLPARTGGKLIYLTLARKYRCTPMTR